MKSPLLPVAAMLLSVLLVACDGGPEREAVREYAATATPGDTDLGELYERSCKSCHARSGSGAPLTGDARTWQRLIDNKGLDRLLEHTIHGYRGMPPMGHCMDCDREDFRRLIDFMAQGPQT